MAGNPSGDKTVTNCRRVQQACGFHISLLLSDDVWFWEKSQFLKYAGVLGIKHEHYFRNGVLSHNRGAYSIIINVKTCIVRASA